MSKFASKEDLYKAKAEHFEQLAEKLKQEAIMHAQVDNEVLDLLFSSNLIVTPYRSGGFLNKSYDRGRIEFNLPLIEANRLVKAIKILFKITK